MKFVRSFVLCLSLVAMAGCVAVEDKKLIQTGSSVGQGNLREWDTLTPEQQKEAHFNLVGAFVYLDNHINGTAIPPAFASLAPVTSEGQ